MKNHPLALNFLKITRDQDIRHLILASIAEICGDPSILTTMPTQLCTTQQILTGTHKLATVKYTIRTKIKPCFPSEEMAIFITYYI